MSSQKNTNKNGNIENMALIVKSASYKQKFDTCGIASANAIDPENRLGDWLAAGYHADMHWMERNAEVRRDPRIKLPGAKSVVVVTRNYYSPDPPERVADSGKVARYARGRDYHKVMRKPLIALAKAIESMEEGARTYSSIDTGPVMERAWAQRSGVAAIGKNSLALQKDAGSYFFLATILTTVELAPDKPASDICGSCRLCLDACPTAAIVEPMVVDSNRCISYHTIENRGSIPEALQPDFGDWVFGCDVCQEVCPWNRFSTPTTEEALTPDPARSFPELQSLQTMSTEEFDKKYAGSAIRRAKAAGMKRNAAIAEYNRLKEDTPGL